MYYLDQYKEEPPSQRRSMAEEMDWSHYKGQKANDMPYRRQDAHLHALPTLRPACYLLTH